jgi:radical SAM superfamily enzyme YgiQ (UPF0313 family)
MENFMNIGLVQINESFSGQNYFPYSIGLMQSYAEKHYVGKEQLFFKDMIYKRIDVNEAVSRLYTFDLVGFSTYMWNIKISLKIAKEIKKINPSCFIVFGGPQVPYDAEEFLNENKFVNMTVQGEGEQAFTEILNRFETKDFSNILSTCYLKEDGTYIRNPRQNRIKTLDTIPSPYLSGTFDTLIKNNPDEKWLVMWETNRGCPFSCTFCDWGAATAAKVNQFNLERLYKEVDWIAKHKIEFLFCCDANYGILPRDLDIANYVAQVKKNTGYPHALSVQNTKNSTERAYQVQKVLSDAGLNKGVTLSMQSVDTTTLLNVKRANISLNSFKELQNRFAKDGIETYSDMIIGLPGETYDTFTNGIDEIIVGGQHNRIQFGNLAILPNAEMGNPEYQKKYGMKFKESKTINMHGSLIETEDESIHETQQLVVSTDSMPNTDWIKTRAYCWMVALLYYNKILQIPLVVITSLMKIKHKEIFESFMNVNDSINFPIITEIRDCFINKANDMQNGGVEHIQSKEWLNIWWPTDEYIFIKLVKENKIKEFYNECELMLIKILEKNENFSKELVHQCIELNFALLKIPFDSSELNISLSYNIYEYYKSIIKSSNVNLIAGNFQYTIDRSFFNNIIDWNDWYKNVVWYGNKKGAYLHNNVSLK